MTTPKYGPGVLGEEEFQKQKEAAAGANALGGGPKYGPAVTAKHPAGTDPLKAVAAAKAAEDEAIDADEAEEILEEAGGDDDYTNLEEFKAALGDDPAKVPAFLENELNREDGARKGALQALRKVEKAQGDDARPDVLAMIDDALEADDG